MPEVDITVLLIPIALSGIAIFISTWIGLSNLKRAEKLDKLAEKKDVLEMAAHLKQEYDLSERMTAEQIADMQRRLARLEGRQEERDKAKKNGAIEWG